MDVDDIIILVLLLVISGLSGVGGGMSFLDSVYLNPPGTPAITTAPNPQATPTSAAASVPTPTSTLPADCLSKPTMDTFDSTVINQTLWAIPQDTGKIGKISLTGSSVYASAGGNVMSFSGLMTRKKACGDFETKINLTNFTAGDVTEGVARLSIEKAFSDIPDFSSDSVVAEIYKKGAQYAIKAIHYLSDIPLESAETDYLSSSTQLKIARQNKDFSLYYYNSGWVLLKKFLYVGNSHSFIFFGVKSSVNNPSVSVNFDDFEYKDLFSPDLPTATTNPNPTATVTPSITPHQIQRDEANRTYTTASCKVDYKEAPALDAFAKTVVQLCQENYPKIAQILGNSNLQLPFDMVLKSRPSAPAVTSGYHIELSIEWFTNHPDDLGAIIHEMTHSVQAYPSGSNFWLTEGIADYIRYSPGYQDSGSFPHCSSGENYTIGYWCGAAFLQFMEKTYDNNIVKKLDSALRGGVYNDSLFTTYTGKDLSTLWNECKSQECSGGS